MLSCFEVHQYQTNEKKIEAYTRSELIYQLGLVRGTHSSLLMLIGVIAMPTVPGVGVLGVWLAKHCKFLEQHTLPTHKYSPEHGGMQPCYDP